MGYIASAVRPSKENFGPADDVKSVLPIQQKLERAILLSDEGKTQESVREVNALIAMKKDFGPAYLFLSQLLMSQKKFREAIWVLDESIKNIPESYGLHEAYATTLIQAGQWDKAQEILEINPVTAKLQKLNTILSKELEVLELGRKIQSGKLSLDLHFLRQMPPDTTKPGEPARDPQVVGSQEVSTQVDLRSGETLVLAGPCRSAGAAGNSAALLLVTATILGRQAP